jgi:hypothetical protein
MMKTLLLSLLLAAPTPPGLLALVFLITFLLTHALLKEVYYAHQ